MPEEYMTVAEVAEILKLNQQTIRNMLDRGDLPFVRLGRRVRIKRSDFDRFVEQGYTQSPATPAAQHLGRRRAGPRAAVAHDRRTPHAVLASTG
jgi:excisionase family DNA binding protein